jgi:mannose-6-phosphate isomerase-like protein (cupin superfamily)
VSRPAQAGHDARVGRGVLLLAALTLIGLPLATLGVQPTPARAGSPSADGASSSSDRGSHDEVRYFPASEVNAAFDKGAVLLDAGSFMVHASRREGPGMAEIHLKDTDIIHVLQGSATVVTGGDVVNGRPTAEDEIRGASIRNGAMQILVQGDVMVVPRGVPHWFREVRGPFLYYVVKVR